MIPKTYDGKLYSIWKLPSKAGVKEKSVFIRQDKETKKTSFSTDGYIWYATDKDDEAALNQLEGFIRPPLSPQEIMNRAMGGYYSP